MEGENNNANNNASTNVITNEEKGLIAKLKERVLNGELPKPVQSFSDEDKDLFLVRWLRARDLDLEKAVKMLLSSLQWRKEKNADQAINLKIHPFFPENYPHAQPGTDKFGQPVFLIPLSSWDFRKVVNDSERLAEFDDFVTNFYETICSEIRTQHLNRKETGHKNPITQMSMVIDVKNYSYMQLINIGAFKKILQIAATYEAHYPEILYRAVFVNCPSYFGLFIKMLKPVIAPKTLSKLICYSQLSEWQKNMVDFIDPAILPEQYGGTKDN